MTLNKAILVGNLGQDPVVKTTQSGAVVCNMRIATSEYVKDASGASAEKTEWHNVVCFGKVAERCGQHLKKGSKILIEGKIQTRKFKNKDGVEQSVTEIIADSSRFMGDKKEESASSPAKSESKAKPQLPAIDDSPQFEEDDVPF